MTSPGFVGAAPRREWPRTLFLAKVFALCGSAPIRELSLAQRFQQFSLNLNLRPVVLQLGTLNQEGIVDSFA